MLLALAAAVTTLMMVMLPSTASAEPSPGDVRAERTADVAADRELDFAVRGTPPSRDEMKCAATSVPGTMEVCYEPAGDRWWVQDLESDGASALGYWFNYRDSGALTAKAFASTASARVSGASATRITTRTAGWKGTCARGTAAPVGA